MYFKKFNSVNRLGYFVKWEIFVNPVQGVHVVNLKLIINIYCIVFLKIIWKRWKLVGFLTPHGLLFTLFAVYNSWLQKNYFGILYFRNLNHNKYWKYTSGEKRIEQMTGSQKEIFVSQMKDKLSRTICHKYFILM